MARARTLLLNTKVSVTGEDKLRGLAGTFKKAFSPQNLAVGGIALAGALTAGLAAATRALIDIERLNAQTEAVIKSTGGVANVTRQQIEDAAEAAEDATTIQRESVQEAQNMLLTFTNVRDEVGTGNDIFTQGTDAVLDMSVALGVDARDAALQLGKALNDPITGMSQLSRAGIQFTESQKELVKELVATGDLLGAQKIILAELETQFGGSAEAFANTTAGKIQRFQNDVGDAFESIILGAAKVSDFLGQEVDLWPFDDQAEIIKANAASMGVDAGNAYAAGVAAQVTAGKEAVETAADFALRDPVITALLGGKEEAERIASETPGGIAQALLDNQFSVEDAMAELARVAEEALHPMIERANIIAFLSSAAVARGVTDGNPIVAAAWQEQVAIAEARLAELEGVAFTSGYNAAAAFAQGMIVGKGLVVNAANELAGAARSQIGIQSEPSDHSSPLYGITKWGGNIAKTLAAGMLSELGGVRGVAGRLAGALVPSFGGSLVAFRAAALPQPQPSARRGDIHIHLNIGGDLKAEERTLPGIIVRGLNAAGIS